MGSLRIGVVYLGSLKMDWNADVTTGPVFDFMGTIYKNIERTSIAINKYLWLSLNLLRAWASYQVAFPNIQNVIQHIWIAWKSATQRFM